VTSKKSSLSPSSKAFHLKLYFENLREDCEPINVEDLLQRPLIRDLLQQLQRNPGISEEDVRRYLLTPEQNGTCTNLPTRGLSADTIELIQVVREILDDVHPQTLRQVFYAVNACRPDKFPNENRSYRRLSRHLTPARRLYREWELAGEIGEPPEHSINWRWIVDEGRKPEKANFWKDANEYVESVRESYRRDRWQDQPEYIELWGEKATVLQAMRPIIVAWGITLRVCRGFASSSMENQVGELFEGIGKPITVLYVGDHDPSGHMIEEELHKRIEKASGVRFSMKRLAIHKADIQRFSLPSQKLKSSNHDVAGFVKKYGKQTVELEALPARELRRRVIEAIREHIDFERWNQQEIVEAAELECIERFADTMKNLKQLKPKKPGKR